MNVKMLGNEISNISNLMDCKKTGSIYWAIANSVTQIDAIIRECDDAFIRPISSRTEYSNLLEKIYQNGIVLYAYNTEVMGYCALYANDYEKKIAFISLLAVKKQFQKMHIGKELLDQALNVCRSRGMMHCVLEVRKDNPTAQIFYKKNNFIKIGEKERCIIMKRSLNLKSSQNNGMKSLSLDQMLQDGYSIKMAEYYIKLLKHEKERGLWSDEKLEWAHSRGFLAESVAAYSLTDDNIGEYLSDYDYFRIWPLNDWERIWINDKLSLKMVLYGTKWDKYLAKYYFYKTTAELVPLVDYPKDICDSEEMIDLFLNLLRKEKNIACKPNNGSLSKGFFKLSYERKEYRINDQRVTREEICKFVSEHTNYIYQEYFVPSEEMAKIYPLIHTIRILVINDDGRNPKIAASYLRFGTKHTGEANYSDCAQNDEFVYDCFLDNETGKFNDALITYADKIVDCPCHPDTGTSVEGKIMQWDEIKDVVISLSKHLSPCEYFGFDVCITSKGIKIMEINTHSGIKHLQVRKPLLSEEWIRQYYERKIQEINNMTVQQKEKRNSVIR